MNSDEREVIEARVKELTAKLATERQLSTGFSAARLHRLEGNIGALEWVLREFPDERHISGCICADCSGAELTARND